MHYPARQAKDQKSFSNIKPGSSAMLIAEQALSLEMLEAVGIPGCTTSYPILLLTYEPEWVRCYMERNYFQILPVVICGCSSFLLIDWSHLDRRANEAQRFFSEADRFRVGRQGITIPTRGPGSERALFTLTSNVPSEEWRRQRLLLIFQFQLMAHMVHDQAARLSDCAQLAIHPTCRGANINAFNRLPEVLRRSRSPETSACPPPQ
jgi:hypothetical protein